MVGFMAWWQFVCDGDRRISTHATNTMGDLIMKTAKELMLGYIGGTAQQSGALFAEDGTLELPYLASIGLPPVLKGPSEIAKFLGFLHGTLYPEFEFENVKVLIDGGQQVFAEYQISHKSGISGKFVKQQ